mgnify:FL=1
MTLAVIDQNPPEILPAEFDRQLANAHLKAQSLARIVEGQHLYTDIQGRKHLHVEAWVTIAKGYGYNVDIEWTHPLEEGGYEARAMIMDAGGQVIGHADAECGSEGDGLWVGRPNFQQRSMAQTRAISKVARNHLAWVVVLAGYSPTPSEEMTTPVTDKTEHWCSLHGTIWFKKGKMRNFANPIGDTKEWCGEPQVEVPAVAQASPAPAAAYVQLVAAITASGMTWDHFEIQVLGKSWAEFSKVKGATPAVALAKWETWKRDHPSDATEDAAAPAGTEAANATE